MNTRIVSRELIARQADAAAEWAASHQDQPAPRNPYDEFLEPDHHQEWACDFTRHLSERIACDGTEASA